MSDNLRSLQYTRAPLKEIEQALEKPDIKVGELALLALGSILQHPDFPQEYLEKFRGKEYSKKVFGLSYPMLIRKREWTKTAQYYADYLCCKANKQYYCLTSSWTEAHRFRLLAWIKRHKIDREERRREWNLDAPLPTQSPKKSTSLSKDFFAGRTSHNATWVIDVGRIKQKLLDIPLTVCISKRLLEMIAKQGRLCVIQARVADVVKLYTIEALNLDKAFWRDEKYYSSENDRENWSFLLQPSTGKLFNSRGKKVCFGTCRVGSARQSIPVEVYHPKTLPAWVNDVPKPVCPVLPSLRSRKVCQKRRVKANAPVKNRPVKEPLEQLPLQVALPLDNEPRVRVEILTSELKDTKLPNKRWCVFMQNGVNKGWEIPSDDLITCLQSKRVAPIIYKDRGEVWQFYLDVEQGLVYKHSTGGSEVLRLREVPLSSKE